MTPTSILPLDKWTNPILDIWNNLRSTSPTESLESSATFSQMIAKSAKAYKAVYPSVCQALRDLPEKEKEWQDKVDGLKKEKTTVIDEAWLEAQVKVYIPFRITGMEADRVLEQLQKSIKFCQNKIGAFPQVQETLIAFGAHQDIERYRSITALVQDTAIGKLKSLSEVMATLKTQIDGDRKRAAVFLNQAFGNKPQQGPWYVELVTWVGSATGLRKGHLDREIAAFKAREATQGFSSLSQAKALPDESRSSPVTPPQCEALPSQNPDEELKRLRVLVTQLDALLSSPSRIPAADPAPADNV